MLPPKQWSAGLATAVAYFRQKARQCRRLAGQIGTRSGDPAVASLIALAVEFDSKAALLAAEPTAALAIVFGDDIDKKLRMTEQSSAGTLNHRIAEVCERISREEPSGPASPERGMRQLRGAKAKNELVKLKNRRAKLKGKNE